MVEVAMCGGCEEVNELCKQCHSCSSCCNCVDTALHDEQVDNDKLQDDIDGEELME